MDENEKSSTAGSFAVLPAKPADRAEGPFMLPKKRGECSAGEVRDWRRGPEYVRTTTGWLESVVRLDVDLAGLLAVVDEACDWKAGALRARRAADWVCASVFVSVVVVLGTELVLVVRSEGGSCASGEGAWAMLATGDATSGLLWGAAGGMVGLPPLRQSVDSATD
jgi:hypothetical protein